MSAEKLYSEIFEEFDKAQNKTERINVLKKYDHLRFREFLVYALDPTIEFDVEIPNYRPAIEPAGLNFTYLDLEMSKMYRFIKGHKLRPVGLTSEKQKSLLLVILESLHKDEADLLVKVIKRDLEVKFLTKKLVQEAYGM
jgi:hypothetical protein